MFLFSFDAVPAPGNEYECLGAIVCCWVDFKDFHGAEFLARRYVESQGWTIKGEEGPPQIPRRSWFRHGLDDEAYDNARVSGKFYVAYSYQNEE